MIRSVRMVVLVLVLEKHSLAPGRDPLPSDARSDRRWFLAVSLCVSSGLADTFSFRFPRPSRTLTIILLPSFPNTITVLPDMQTLLRCRFRRLDVFSHHMIAQVKLVGKLFSTPIPSIVVGPRVRMRSREKEKTRIHLHS